jgi:O-acetyl-ADP-ribose deacetylase (regulator of RNase III)
MFIQALMEFPENFILCDGDILNFDKTNCIAQQSNCVTVGNGKGLYAIINKKYPSTDVYTEGRMPSIPGTISVKCSKESPQVIVIHMFGQYYPGRAKFPNDTLQKRELWFESCLERVGKTIHSGSIAFPHGIGCGLAGGNWDTYQTMLVDFAKKFPHLKVYIVKKQP